MLREDLKIAEAAWREIEESRQRYRDHHPA